MLKISRQKQALSNIDLNNSGSRARYDAPAVPKFGVQQKKGKTQLNTPIQPVNYKDPRYVEDIRSYNDRFSINKGNRA